MTAERTDPPFAPAATPAPPLRARRARTARSILALMLREMSSTYGRSPGGYVWALLEPVGAIAMFTLIIALGLRLATPSVGISFALFFATGVLPYRLFLTTSRNIAAAITYSRPLLFYPSVTYTDAILARFFLQMMTQSLIFCIVMGAILTLFDTRALIHLPSVLLSLAMAASLGLGLGVLNAYLFPTFPLWRSVWGILTTPLFFLSTILFAYEDMPVVGQDVLWYNPLVHVVGVMRRGFYGIYDAAWASPVYVFALAGVMTLLGFVLLGRYYRFIANREFD